MRRTSRNGDNIGLTGWISPDTLLSQVRNTAPFLYPLPPVTKATRIAPLAGEGSLGYRLILSAAEGFSWESLTESEELVDYFTLCLACHHATVATFVPTDVDSKIRGLAFFKTHDREVLREMMRAGQAMHSWSLDGISTRAQFVEDIGPVSGHDGEWLSVMAGALGRMLQCGDLESAGAAAEAIDMELRRELRAFRRACELPGRELDVLRLAMSITHNIGDLDQGISFWESKTVTAQARERFGRLAHENKAAYEGGFQPIADLYRKALAAEGHRHYPLRPVKPLRKSPDLLLPLGPFFDEWGQTVMRHPDLDLDEKAEVLDALARGCRKVSNQQGYYRAIAGMREASRRDFDAAAERMPNAGRKELKDPELRRLVDIPRQSFESRMKKTIPPALRSKSFSQTV